MNLSARLQKRLGPGFDLDVTLAVPPGITMVFGASGSGKTTLLRSLAGLTTPDTGAVRIGNTVLFDRAGGVNVPVEKRRVGFVFQQLALFPHMTVADNIGYGLTRLSKSARQDRVQSAADAFRIGHTLTRRPDDVSGGERQRAALARALVLDPSLLLLDEPLSALDHDAQSRIIDDLRRWNDTHAIPILYVTHSHREVYALGDRVLAMERGRIIAEGAPSDVLEAPGHETVARLAGFENVFAATIVERRPESGTMRCRLVGQGSGHDVDLEVPFTRTDGDRVRVAIRAGDILVAVEPPRGLSARNILPGSVDAVRQEGPTAVVSVTAGEPFAVHLTPAAVDALRLAPGTPVWLVIKTYSCRVLSA